MLSLSNVFLGDFNYETNDKFLELESLLEKLVSWNK